MFVVTLKAQTVFVEAQEGVLEVLVLGARIDVEIVLRSPDLFEMKLVLRGLEMLVVSRDLFATNRKHTKKLVKDFKTIDLTKRSKPKHKTVRP